MSLQLYCDPKGYIERLIDKLTMAMRDITSQSGQVISGELRFDGHGHLISIFREATGHPLKVVKSLEVNALRVGHEIFVRICEPISSGVILGIALKLIEDFVLCCLEELCIRFESSGLHGEKNFTCKMTDVHL
jgi:hypothetical protein